MLGAPGASMVSVSGFLLRRLHTRASRRATTSTIAARRRAPPDLRHGRRRRERRVARREHRRRQGLAARHHGRGAADVARVRRRHRDRGWPGERAARPAARAAAVAEPSDVTTRMARRSTRVSGRGHQISKCDTHRRRPHALDSPNGSGNALQVDVGNVQWGVNELQFDFN